MFLAQKKTNNRKRTLRYTQWISISKQGRDAFDPKSIKKILDEQTLPNSHGCNTQTSNKPQKTTTNQSKKKKKLVSNQAHKQTK